MTAVFYVGEYPHDLEGWVGELVQQFDGLAALWE
jgi:hypothetical protein